MFSMLAPTYRELIIPGHSAETEEYTKIVRQARLGSHSTMTGLKGRWLEDPSDIAKHMNSLCERVWCFFPVILSGVVLDTWIALA